MKVTGTVQLITVSGITVIAVIAACMREWSIVNVCIAGGFALLRGGSE